MRRWNYRVVVERTEHGPLYSIREVYYRDDGSVAAWTAEPCHPLGEDMDWLKEDFRLMELAFGLPILDVTDEENPVEVAA